MDYFEIKESKKLYGSVKVSGAKNAVLPLMAASILNKKKIKILNVPTSVSYTHLTLPTTPYV